MKTVKQVYQVYSVQLSALYPNTEIEAITTLVLTELTGMGKALLKAYDDKELTAAQQDSATRILTELQTGKPVQYILSHTEFFGLKFNVNPSVLIPRPETEELVQWILDTVTEKQLAQINILDIGTGSGCIPIALKSRLPQSQVITIDISPGALATAKENATMNNADIQFYEADILNMQEPAIMQQQYDIIVSNPPYVTLAEQQQMHTNVTNFEPHTALFVPHDKPLLFYEAIADFGMLNLRPGGYLFFEINESYGLHTTEMLINKGFINTEIKKDFFNRDRMVKATKL